MSDPQFAVFIVFDKHSVAEIKAGVLRELFPQNKVGVMVLGKDVPTVAPVKGEVVNSGIPEYVKDWQIGLQIRGRLIHHMEGIRYGSPYIHESQKEDPIRSDEVLALKSADLLNPGKKRGTRYIGDVSFRVIQDYVRSFGIVW